METKELLLLSGSTMERCEFPFAKDYRSGAQMENVPWPTLFGARNEVEQAARRCKEPGHSKGSSSTSYWNTKPAGRRRKSLRS
jgi:hypothetical protein